MVVGWVAPVGLSASDGAGVGGDRGGRGGARFLYPGEPKA